MNLRNIITKMLKRHQLMKYHEISAPQCRDCRCTFPCDAYLLASGMLVLIDAMDKILSEVGTSTLTWKITQDALTYTLQEIKNEYKK